MLPNIHILGIQGSGKGTQSALLVERYRLTYASSGNLFRQRAERQDELGQQLAAELKSGRLLADRLLIETVRDFLATSPMPVGFLGDGVIRTIEQYRALLSLWELHGLEPPYLVHLVLDQELALQRIQQRERELADPAKSEHYRVYGGKLAHRTDDNPAAIEERFAQFHRMTEPVIRLFREQGRCLSLPADRPVEEVHDAICRGLEQAYPGLCR